MQRNFFLSRHKPFPKDTSKLSLASTSCSSVSSISSTSTATVDDQYVVSVIKWIFNYSKNLSKDTQYLAVSYVNELRNKQIFINKENYLKIAVSTLLIAFKINERAIPKISTMLTKCTRTITKQDIIDMEYRILSAFDFNMNCQKTTYSYINNLLGDRNLQKIEECEKLLKLICTNQQAYQFGEKIMALSIILLVFPQFNPNINLHEIIKIRNMGRLIFNMYYEAKERHYQEKRRSLK